MSRYSGCVLHLSVALLVSFIVGRLTQPIRAAQPQPIDATGRVEEGLCFRFNPGDKYFLTSVTEQKTTQAKDGNELVSEQMQRIGCDLDIEDVEQNGSAWARYTYRRAALRHNEPQMQFEFDSEANNPRIPVPALAVSTLVGEGFYIRITPEGGLTKINGLASVTGSAKGKVHPNVSGREQILQTIEAQLDEAEVKRQMEELLAVFPDPPRLAHPSRLGVEPRQDANDAGAGREPTIWRRTQSMEKNGVSVLIEKSCRLKGVVNGVAMVDVNLLIRSDPNSGRSVQGGAMVRRQISGEGRGTLEIEQSSGRIINSRLTRHAVESLEVTAEGPVLRLPPVSEPIHTYITTTFQMTKRE